MSTRKAQKAKTALLPGYRRLELELTEEEYALLVRDLEEHKKWAETNGFYRGSWLRTSSPESWAAVKLMIAVKKSLGEE